MARLIKDSDATFFYKKPAWHDLGLVLDRQIEKQDLITAFGYHIDKQRLALPSGTLTNTYATVRKLADGSEIILGDKLSAGYTVLQNTKLIDGITPLLDAGSIIETAGTLDEGRRVWLLLRLQNDMIIGDADQINCYILVSNEHTGAESLRVGFVPIRVVCANTLGMAHNSSASNLLRIKHTDSVNLSFDQAVKMIDSANGQFLAYGEQLDLLAQTSIEQADIDAYVKRVFFPTLDARESAAQTEAEKKRVQEDKNALVKKQNIVNELFQTEPSIVDYPETNGTAYGAYHAVNFFLNHTHAIGQERRLTSLMWGDGAGQDARALREALALAGSKA